MNYGSNDVWSHYDSNRRIQEIHNFYENRRLSEERRAKWNSYFNTTDTSTNHVPEDHYSASPLSDTSNTQDNSRATDNQCHNSVQIVYVQPPPPPTAAGL